MRLSKLTVSSKALSATGRVYVASHVFVDEFRPCAGPLVASLASLVVSLAYLVVSLASLVFYFVVCCREACAAEILAFVAVPRHMDP
jgi:hypothetical protein